MDYPDSSHISVPHPYMNPTPNLTILDLIPYLRGHHTHNKKVNFRLRKRPTKSTNWTHNIKNNPTPKKITSDWDLINEKLSKEHLNFGWITNIPNMAQHPCKLCQSKDSSEGESYADWIKKTPYEGCFHEHKSSPSHNHLDPNTTKSSTTNKCS